MGTRRTIERPEVSILVLTYNHADYIRTCLISLAHLDYVPVEVIVLDDGSPDGTAEIVRRTAAEIDLEIELLEQPNSGGRTADNLDRLVAASRGSLIMFMSGDDMLGPGYPLGAIVASLEGDHGLDMVLPQRIQFGADASVTPVQLYHGRFLDALRSSSPERMLAEHLHHEVGRIFLQGMVVRREVVNAAGGFDAALLADDYAFAFRTMAEMARRGTRFVFDEAAFWLYRTHQGNIHKMGLRQSSLIVEVVAKYVPSKHWHRFQWQVAAMATLDELRQYRDLTVRLLDRDTARVLADKAGRRTVRQARRSGDGALLEEICRATDLSVSIRLAARVAAWPIRWRAHAER